MSCGNAKRILTTTQSIPQAQGDPLSSLVFAVGFAPALQHMSTQGHQPYANADDTILTSSPDHLDDALRLWQAQLRDRGLRLNFDKFEVWDPHGHAIHATAAAPPTLRVTEYGFVVLGRQTKEQAFGAPQTSPLFFWHKSAKHPVYDKKWQ